LALGLVSTAFTSAQAATPAATTTPISKPAPLRADVLCLLGQPTNRSTLAPPLTGIIGMSSVCPAGQSLGTVHGVQSFEAGLPFPDPLLTDGFTVATGPDAPEGLSWAGSTMASTDPTGFHYVTSNHDVVPQTGKVYLSFSYRGTYVDVPAFTLINSDVWELAATPTWTTVHLDITSEATTAGDGTVAVTFLHVADLAATTSLDIDNVSIYSCVAPAPPNSRVRGDWTGQGTVDLMATRTDGTLWVYDGNGTSRPASGSGAAGHPSPGRVPRAM
jgi:hypothetical protein